MDLNTSGQERQNPHTEKGTSLLFGGGREANLPFSLLGVTVILTGRLLSMEQVVIHKTVHLCKCRRVLCCPVPHV